MSGVKIFSNEEKINLFRHSLNTTLKDIMSVLEAECGSLFLFDYEKKELVLDSLHNSDSLSLKGLRQRIGEGVAGKVVGLKTPILVKDIDKDSRFHKNGFNHYRTKSFISIPLFSSRGLMGVINIADKANGESFSDKDFNYVVFLCKYACITIDSLVNYIELKQDKEALDKQKSLLEKYASVGKLTAGIVHEVNNPLDGILRYTNMLLLQIEHNSIARDYLLEIKKGLNRIGDITKSLLDFFYLVNANFSKRLEKEINLHELIDDSLDILKNKIPTNIQINKRYKENLPKVFDFGLSHVVTNIIKNALDAMPSGGTLEIFTDVKDSTISVSFKDTGHGMSCETMKNIFEPFFTTKSIDRGTGLGLAICNEIIKKYDGGRIQVESSEDKGSNFTVLIPKNN